MNDRHNKGHGFLNSWINLFYRGYLPVGMSTYDILLNAGTYEGAVRLMRSYNLTVSVYYIAR